MNSGSNQPITSPASSGPRAIFRKLAKVALAISCSSLLGVITGCGSSSMGGRLSSTEKMMWSTYPLGTQKGMATGFVVDTGQARSPQQGDTTSVTIVTSLHAIATVGRKPLLIATRIVEDDGTPSVILIQIQQPKGKRLFFVKHPSADLAAFRVRIPGEAAGMVQMPTFLSPGNIPRSRSQIRPGMDVSFVGYPEVLPGTDGAFPVLRAGKVASYSPGRLSHGGKFIINADVYPGDSGAPVFATRRGKAEIVGMIIQRIGTAAQDFSHLAVAVDSASIRETLDLLAATNPNQE